MIWKTTLKGRRQAKKNMTTVPNIRTICLLVNLISATVHIAEPVLVRGVVRHVHDFTKKQFFVKKIETLFAWNYSKCD